MGVREAASAVMKGNDAGGHGGEEIPVPIPNTEVKLSCADDSGAQPRESRWLLIFYFKENKLK